MEAFNEDDTTRTRLGIVIKEIRRQEESRKRQQDFMVKLWAWCKKCLSYAVSELKRSNDLRKWLNNVLSFAHSEAEKIRLEE